MRHIPVLLNEVISSLRLKSGHNVIDCTLGDGGHAQEVLEHTSPNGRLLGIDADRESLQRAKEFLIEYKNRTIFVEDNFANLEEIVKTTGFGPINAILMDFGWSSPQFADRGRGFSFQNADERLDMRYCVENSKIQDTNKSKITNLKSEITQMTAEELLNTFDESEIEKILREYGEEKLSKEIAKAIVECRKSAKGGKIETVGDLVEIILAVYRKKLKTDKEIPWIGGLHPATKSFQAIRIVVNNELGVIRQALPQAVGALASGGRLAVITFHSLEDRIVKHFFKSLSSNQFTIITKKPLEASEEEYKNNPPSRSAKLRIIEKI